MPPGSGEGLAELLYDDVDEIDPDSGKSRKVRKLVHHNVFLPLDEGRILGDLGDRKGSTLVPTLCAVWTGGPLGQANANRDRFRPVPRNGYVYGLVVVTQTSNAGAILDAAGTGLPQRFGWALATDPTVPDDRPDWPGPLDWSPPPEISGGQLVGIAPEVAAEITAADLARVRGEVVADPLDAHAGLYRLKVAAVLAVLDRRTDVNVEDWTLAGVVKTSSDAVRARVVAEVSAGVAERERRRRDRQVRTAVATDEAVDRRRKVIEYAAAIADKVTAEPGKWSRAELRKSGGKSWRELFAEALAHALDEELTHERSEPGQGTDKVRLWPGARG